MIQQVGNFGGEPKPSQQHLSCFLLFSSRLQKLPVGNVFRRAKEKSLFFLVLPFYCLLPQSPTAAQLTPDTTLGGENSIVTPGVIIQGQSAERIDGGALRNTNLFHSFLQFNLNAGQRVYFTSPAGVENIFTRVTGSEPSNIFGTLGVDGAANLFLINPNGILFGTNARLDLRGSFFASTVNSIVFEDRNSFSATAPQTSVLTVKVPVGLQFQGNPKPIQVQGANLQVRPGETLGLVGGEVLLQGGLVAAPSGRVELGSVAGSGLVNLNATSADWKLSYSAEQNFQNIQLSQGATVDVSGPRGGEIQVQARSFQLSEGARLTAFTQGSQPGGTITVNASDSVELTGTGQFVDDTIKFAAGTLKPTDLRNGLFTGSSGSGAAGNVVINTAAFIAQNGAFVTTSTFGSGRGGNLTVNASNVDLRAASLFTGTGTGSRGDAGSLTVNTERLVAQDLGNLSTVSFGAGRSGDLTVNASELVQLMGSNPVSLPPNARLLTGFFGSSLANGETGDLRVVTERLEVRDGAAISSNTFGQGKGGDVTVIASDAVELSGSSPDGQALSALTNGTEVGSTGAGGNLRIQTDQLRLQDGGRLSVRSRGTGNAGDIEVVANSIYQDNQASIAAATTTSGEGGNVRLQTQTLQLRHNSIISAEAGGSGNGGNIEIDTDSLVVLEGSEITANAFQGTGGNIQIDTQGLFVAPTSKITASSTLGINGVVNINTSLDNIQTSVTPLEVEFVSSDQLVATSCLAQRNFDRGSFTVTGVGGLPSSPYTALMERYATTEIQDFDRGAEEQRGRGAEGQGGRGAILNSKFKIENSEFSSQPSTQNWQLGQPIEEAQGIALTADGRVIAGTIPQLRTVAKAEQIICNSHKHSPNSRQDS